jgi:hypothetical protein
MGIIDLKLSQTAATNSAASAAPQQGPTTEIRVCKVFDSGDANQRSVVKLLRTNIPSIIVAITKTSAAVVKLFLESGELVALSRKASNVVTEYDLLHAHLPRELLGNPSFVLLSAETNDTCVKMHTFLLLSNLVSNTSEMTLSIPSSSPARSTDTLDEMGAAHRPTSPSLPPGGGSKLTSFLSNLFKPKGQSKKGGRLDLFAPQVTTDGLLGTYVEGYCRKGNRPDLPYRIIALDSRLHGFLVWMHMLESDEIFLLRDEALHHSLSIVRPFEE